MARAKSKSKRKVRAAIAKAAARAAAEIAELEVPTLANAPALPARVEPGQKSSEALLSLGPPPKDLLEAQEWFYKVLVTSAHDTLVDENISNKERRRELRSIGASAAALFPDAVRAEAIRIIKEDADRLKARAKSKGGAKLEPVKSLEPSPASDSAALQ